MTLTILSERANFVINALDTIPYTIEIDGCFTMFHFTEITNRTLLKIFHAGLDYGNYEANQLFKQKMKMYELI